MRRIVQSVFALLPLCGFCQKPVVYPGGVVNGASFAKAGTPSSAIGGGSIVAIFGENLAAGTEQASKLPLPKTLAGTSVTISGVPAPLFYVSPGQINAQAPQALVLPGIARTPVDVVVTTGAGSSDPVKVEVDFDGLGIFTLDGSGCGRAAILNVAQNGSVSLNGPENSVSPGEYLTVFGTGAFDVNGVGRVPDGEPWPADPLRRVPVSHLLGPLYVFSEESFLAPGLVGVSQVNFRVPDTALEGCSVPLRIAGPTSTSQAVPVSVRRGGGRCEPPPPSTAVVVEWRKSKVSSLAGQRTTDRITVEFTDETVKTFSYDPLPPGWCFWNNLYPAEGPACPLLNILSVDAGSISARTPSGEFTLKGALAGGVTRYSADLPAGTIRPGTFTVTGSGGADIGRFTTAIDVPAPIEVTSMFPPGSKIRQDQNLVVAWTGGQPTDVVRTTVRSQAGATRYREDGCILFAPKGRFQLITDGRGLGIGSADTTIIVEMVTEDTAVRSFQAAGLVRGGIHRWVYEWRFEDLRIF